MRIVLVFALAAALLGAATARAATFVPTSAMQVVVALAGHPTDVLCDADVNPSPNRGDPHYPPAVAWTVIATGPIHMTPMICGELAYPLGSAGFADGLRIVMREAAIAGPVRSEACAEFVADTRVYDMLRRFYRVPLKSKRSKLIGAQVRQLTRGAPPSYQPALCNWPG